ncbi:MAG: YkgJ family cysteine cluster protein [Pseudomonadota bacterium]
MSQTNDAQRNSDKPCLHCGACCASFRVSSYWAEADAHSLPAHAIDQLTPLYACMAGTNSNSSHCKALLGRVGRQVQCALYPQRPSPCGEVQPGDEKCNQARAKHGLRPVLV